MNHSIHKEIYDMIISDEQSRPVELTSIHVPTISTHFWAYDFKLMDFALSPLLILEETTTPSMLLELSNGARFSLPCKWHVMIVDEDTSCTDLVDVATLAGRDFSIVTVDHLRNRTGLIKTRIIGYNDSATIVNPSIHRHQLMCHPISNDMWILMAPNDMVLKYCKDMVIGDLV